LPAAPPALRPQAEGASALHPALVSCAA